MILAIEFATPRGSVAIVSGGTVLAEEALPAGKQASAAFLDAVARLLRAAGIDGESVTHVGVSAGPGSFTGLRVGMAAAKGLCRGWGVPIVPVPTLHALATRFRAGGAAVVCPVLDARKKEVYAALFRWKGGECVRVAPDSAVDPAMLPGTLPEGDVLFCGDGAAVYGNMFRERMGGRALFPPGGEGHPTAGAVGLLAERLAMEGMAVEAGVPVPLYVRASEAEARRGARPIDK